jgi:hypothetical protein
LLHGCDVAQVRPVIGCPRAELAEGQDLLYPNGRPFMRIVVLVMAGLLSFNLAAEVAAAEKQSAFGVAKVNGRTKVIEDHTYHLVAVHYDPLPLLSISGSRGSFWIIDGEFGEARMYPVDPKEALEGKLPPGLGLVWLRLPAEGKVEMVFGVTAPKRKATPAEVRKLLIQAGYQPFIVEGNIIPAIQVENATELVEQMRRMDKRNPTKR